MSEKIRQELFSKVSSAVVKVGTNVLTDDNGRLDHDLIGDLSGQIAILLKRGIKLAVVSSGAIGAGMDALRMTRRPDDLPRLQACAAIGQARLIHVFDQALSRHGFHAAQILITRDDFEHRSRYLNIRHCIGALQQMGAVPILNENDTVSVDEIRYGDNDIIAALVTHNLRADALVLLTVVEGLYRDKARGDLIDVVETIDDRLTALIDGSRSRSGTGGMGSKLESARTVTQSGEAAVMACGRRKNVLVDLFDGKKVGTLFLPNPCRMTSRKRWLAFSARSRGKLTVDAGAVRALVEGGKSLLAGGITQVAGDFEAGDVVAIVDDQGREIARGLVNYDAESLRKIRGCKSSQFKAILGSKPYDEVIHRDNLVLRS
jgi:glutamate 5-kinase